MATAKTPTGPAQPSWVSRAADAALDWVREAGVRASERDPAGPRTALLWTVLALIVLGFMVQMSHGATTLPRDAFLEEIRQQMGFRLGGIVLLLSLIHI